MHIINVSEPKFYLREIINMNNYPKLLNANRTVGVLRISTINDPLFSLAKIGQIVFYSSSCRNMIVVNMIKITGQKTITDIHQFQLECDAIYSVGNINDFMIASTPMYILEFTIIKHNNEFTVNISN